jgi:8-oxo-dGTP diphosphatase
MPLPNDPDKRMHMFSEDIKFWQKAVVFHPVERNKFLALKRWFGDTSRPGKWDLAGGNVQFGKAVDEELQREIMEEAGITVADIRPVCVKSNFIEVTQIYNLFIGYSCIANSTDIKLSEEHIEYRWVTKNEFLRLDSAKYLMEMVHLLE